MKALTIWQPYAWAIAHADKDVENRSWCPPVSLLGKYIAIHAGKKIDKDAVCSMRQGDYGQDGVDCPSPSELARGCIVAVTHLIGWYRQDVDIVKRHKSVGEFPHREKHSPWLCGPVGWLLDDTKTLLQPIPCRGAQGLWNVPDDVLLKINNQVNLVELVEEAGLR